MKRLFKENPMKKLFVVGLLFALSAAPLYAQSAKNAAQVSSLALVPNTSDPDTGWFTILGNENMFAADAVRIHTSQQKDLIVSLGLECGLYTQTTVRSKGGDKDTSTAQSTVQIRVIVDPYTGAARYFDPGPVTYCDRYQELSATLQGILELACEDTDADGQLDTCDLNVVSEEEIDLVLKTLNANAFFFALDDLGAATHNVIVQARITNATSSQNGSADAWALIGKGALMVEEVRLLKDTDIDLAP